MGNQYCNCGIKLQPYDKDGKKRWYCPRCQKSVSVQPGFELTHNAVIPVEDSVTPGTGIYRDGYECDLCGSEMENKCGAICPNCKWVKPCGING